MIKNLLNNYSNRFLSRWVVLAFDVFSVLTTYVIANFIRHNFEYLSINPEIVATQSILVILAYTLFFVFTKSYSGIIRHTGLNDALQILRACSLAFLILLFVNLLLRVKIIPFTYASPLSVLMIHFMLLSFFLISSRFIIKTVYREMILKDRRIRARVLIYGAGTAGILTRNALMQDNQHHYEVVAYIDDNPGKINKRLEGAPIISAEKALSYQFIERSNISQLIIAIQKLDRDTRKQIIEKGLELNLQVKVVPPIDNWISGRLTSGQLRAVDIEELLGREPIRLDRINVSNDIRDKIVMVTGAAGSIGSEIVRQVLLYNPGRLILIDQAESSLFELQFEINNKKKYGELSKQIVYLVASVKDKLRMESIFKTYRPQIIYHAAAYKHVPLMEDNPYEAIMVNVFGTKIIADLAVRYQTGKFVMISTDKAVNPTNVMGASKRIAEIYTQSLSGESTQFITTRFGNVLGSNGSVIPIFKRQIEKGGPLTITHKEITRFFMTIPEACNLVLEAGAMGGGGEIYIFDMGMPVKIYDLARRMIQLSGLVPEKDIIIIETGLRPGEKLYEELLSSSENNLPTHHPKIMIAKVAKCDKLKTNAFLLQLSEKIIGGDDFDLVKKMKEMVPEFVSNNSVFSTLDNISGKKQSSPAANK